MWMSAGATTLKSGEFATKTLAAQAPEGMETGTPPTAAAQSAATNFLSGGGEMGSRIRTFDWSAHPLGPPESWPQSLRTAVGIILNSQHPMWIGWGPQVSFLYNDAYLHVLGLDKHLWALGRPASEVWAEIWDVCGPLAEKVFREGKATFVDDVQLFMKRGEFLEETYYSFSYSPILDESGKVGGLFCPSNDVSPKVIGARRLHTLSELAANALVERTVDAACATAMETLAKNAADVPFALLYLRDQQGQCAVLQKVPWLNGQEDLLAPKIVDLTSRSVNPVWPLAEVLEDGKTRRTSVPHAGSLPRGMADQPVSEAVVLPVITRNAGYPLGVLIAGVNPTRAVDEDYQAFFELVASNLAMAIQNGRAAEEETRRANELAELDRAKTAFFSNVSHEFRTPLTLMLGPLEEALKDSTELSSAQLNRIETAHRNSLRLLKLVNSLLDFSRIESGRVKASYVPTDLAELTAELASNFRSLIESAGLDFVVDCNPLPQPVYVDHEMWEKIVLNLLSNAFKFTFEGRISVRLSASAEAAILTIADSGTGIPELELPKIFERFHRIEGARGRTYEGTGIGLALIQELVKLHGGQVGVTSRPGAGSTFTVSIPFGYAHLPASQITDATARAEMARKRTEAYTSEALTWLTDDLSVSPHDAAAGANEQTKSTARILLAEDNADMREYVARILGDRYHLVTVADGQAALHEARRMRPDLILSDVMMPKLDGFGLLNALRVDPTTLNIPVIMLSARAGEEARSEGMEAGADDYLVKPFSARELLSRIGAHLKLAKARQEANEQSTLLLESITDGFVALDTDWRFTYVNAEAERLTGMKREELLGRSHWEIYSDASGTSTYLELTRAMKDRVITEFETYYARWDRWFHVKAQPAADGGISVFYEDVTARRKAEAARDALAHRERAAHREAEALNDVARALGAELDLQKLVQTVTDIATQLTGAQFGAFFYNVLNEAGESYMLYTLSGAPREAFEKFGMPRNTPIFAPTFTGLGPRRSDNIREDPDYGTMPNHHGMPKGHLPVTSYLAVPVRSRAGEVLGGLFFGHPDPGVFNDAAERLAMGIAAHAAIAIDNARLFQKAEREITQRRKTEETLRESEGQFRQLTEEGPQIVWLSGPDGSLEFVNRRWIEYSGLDLEATRDSRTIALHLHTDDKVPEHWETAVRSGIPFELEARLRSKGGEFRWFMMRSVPLKDEQGRIVRWFGTSTDIHENKLMQLELKRANQDLEQFAYSASHDLKEPLRSIKIFSELLSARYGEKMEGPALEFLHHLRDGASRMEMLVRDLLAYTQTTTVGESPALTDAEGALSVAMANLTGTIAETNAAIDHDPLPSVAVRETQLQQLFQNLIGNAIKYHRPGVPPDVRIGAKRQGQEWLFSVADNGIGIEPQFRERIFGLFKRLHTDDEYPGTGIGLALCQRIVERHHGRIWVESDPGKGSVFYFTLPAGKL